jgi:hypothetical protein
VAAVLVMVVGFAAGALLTRSTDVGSAAAGRSAASPGLRPADEPVGLEAMRPPPWVTGPVGASGQAQFALVNRTGRRVLVSTPPRFVFTIPPHGRLSFARVPVCTYQRFTARFGDGRELGTIEDFCGARRWVLLRSGAGRLD